MKLFNKFLILLVCGFMTVSCGDDLAKFNVDPDNPATARPQEVLTSVLNYTAFVLDAQYNEEAFIWAQYWTWGPGVSLGDNARYIMEPRDNNQAWARSYSNALADVAFLKKSDNPTYAGMAKVMEAFIYGYAVDHFGDIPYSEAVKGAIEDGSVLAPSFDDDAVIYPQLVTTLDDALADFDRGEDVGPEDLLFAGHVDDWIDFANSLKLRLLMRMSSVTDVSGQVAEVMSNGNFITSNQAQVAFSGMPGSENPMFAWLESGIGNFYEASSTVTAVMDGTEDPRKFVVYDEAPNFPGEIKAGAPHEIALDFGAVDEDWSDPAAITYGAADPTMFMSNWETWFLRCEAALRFGTGDANTAFENAIRANFAHLGADGVDDFITGLGFASANGDDRMELLATQKWVSMTGMQEAEGWIEARRFDTPSTPYFTGEGGIYQRPQQSGLPGRTFPSRFVYPESEQNLNPNFPGQTNVTDMVFWDN